MIYYGSMRVVGRDGEAPIGNFRDKATLGGGYTYKNGS